MKKTHDIMICTDDVFSLPVNIVNTIQEASKWIGCKRDTLYKSFHICGIMRACGYQVILVVREA